MKTKNIYILIAAVLLAIVLIAWAVIPTFVGPTLEVITDKPAYFTSDEVNAEIHLKNAGNANEVQAHVKYDDAMIDLLKASAVKGVSFRQVNNSVIYDASEEFLSRNETKLGEITFDILDRGFAKVEFDQNDSYLNKDGEKIEIQTFIDAEFELGEVPDVPEDVLENTNGSIN